jgi:hypothetical protein
MIFAPGSDIVAALNPGDRLEQATRCSDLAELIRDGEISVIYDGDSLIAILDRYRSKYRQMLATGEA